MSSTVLSPEAPPTEPLAAPEAVAVSAAVPEPLPAAGALDSAALRAGPDAGALGSSYARDAIRRFAAGSAGSALVLYLLFHALGNPRTESADKRYFSGALAAGALAYFARFSRKLDTALAALGVLGLAVMIWGLRTLEKRPELKGALWHGFGGRVTIAALLLLPVVGFVVRPTAAIARPVRLVGYGLLAAVAVVGALSFIQLRNSLPQPDHSAYVFNELYAAAAGHYPYRGFIPQYQTLFSYLFLPLIALLGPEHALSPMLAVLSLLSLATVGLGVLAGILATRGLNRLLAPLLILPFVFITQGPGRVSWSGSISVLHSAFPVRMLLPTLLGVLLGLLPALGAQRWHPYRQLLPLGGLIGLGAFHQIDFGLAAAVAVGVLLAVTEPVARWPLALGRFALGVAGGFLLVPGLHWLAERPLDAGKVGWFVRQFGSGFGSEPMMIPGPVLVVLPLLVGATVTCLGALRSQRAAPTAGADGGDQLGQQRAALIGSYFGLFAIASFPYYLNRSFASGQLQIVLFPLAISLCACAQLISQSPEWREQRGASSKLALPLPLLLRFALCVPIASLLLLPSPRHEWARLTSDAPETTWPGELTKAVVAIGDGWKRLGSRDTVGYFGSDGNYIELMTGMRNVTRFNSPWDASMSVAAARELCAGLSQPGLQVLVLGESALNPNLCGKGSWTLGKSRLGVLVAVKQRVEPEQQVQATAAGLTPAPTALAAAPAELEAAVIDPAALEAAVIDPAAPAL